MSAVQESLAVTIGVRVRAARQARLLTLDLLAAAAQVSRRQLVNIEQGETNPSIGTLLALSDALGIGLPALVEPPTSRLVKITRAGEAAELWRGEHGGRGVLLVGTRPPNVVELWDWVLEPGDQHVSDAHVAGTRELLHVHGGVLTLTVDAEEVTLHPGDALTFPGDVSHAYRNGGQQPATFTLTVYEPGVGSGEDRKSTNV